MSYCALEMGGVEETVLKLNAAAESQEYRCTALKLLKRAEAEREGINLITFCLLVIPLQFLVHPFKIAGISCRYGDRQYLRYII